MQYQDKPLPPLTDEAIATYLAWWNTLSDDWKKAFNQVVFNQGEIISTPSGESLHKLRHITVLRIAGPKALYPNLSFEIQDLEGVRELKRLKVLVVIHSKLQSLKPIKKHRELEQLFVYNNSLNSLEGVEKLQNLRQFYFQNNQITSLEPLKKLINLKEVYASNNALTSLEGVGKNHAKRLTSFRILPNDHLPQKEVIKMENKIGIRCLQG